MKTTIKILCIMLTLIFSISILSATVMAADYPVMQPQEEYPTGFEYNVAQGETLEVKYRIIHRFKDEKAHIRVRQEGPTGAVVFESEYDFNVNPLYTTMSEYIASWNTSDVQPGKYVVEYWMSFYSTKTYRWNEEPTHEFLPEINVVKEHQWDEGSIKVAASPSSAGSKVYTCKVCKKTKTEVLPAKFNDVDSKGYYAPAIDWAFNKGVTSGTTENTFSPNDECTRGQVLTFLWRAMGSPNPTNSANPFKDVSSKQYYYKPILWGVEKGIAGGTSPTTFSPEETCSYAHILTFIWRSQDKPNYTGKGEWYSDAVSWASDNSILDDTSASIGVTASCPRRDVVTFLYRILDEVVGEQMRHKFGKWETTKEATCSTEGSKTRVCTECGEKQVKVISMTEHMLTNADCSTPSKCEKCGFEVPESQKDHTWTEATCLEARRCSVCGTTDGEPLGHTTDNGICDRCKEDVTAIVYSGRGNEVIEDLNLKKGFYKFSMLGNGTSSIFNGDDANGTLSWVNGKDSRSSVFDEAVTNGYIVVKASGKWTITIDKIDKTGTSKLSGKGSCTSPLFELPQGGQTVKLHHNGRGNFSVVVYDDTGKHTSLVDEKGPYEEEKIFYNENSNKRFCIRVFADGEWSVDFGTSDTQTVCSPGE